MNMCFSKEPAPAEIEVCEPDRPLSARSQSGAPGPPPPGGRRRVPSPSSGSWALPEVSTQVDPNLFRARKEAGERACLRVLPDRPAGPLPRWPPLTPSHPVLRVPVRQENVWSPWKPRLCFFLSPVFHLMGLAGCHFCASANPVPRCVRLGRRAGLCPGQSPEGALGREAAPSGGLDEPGQPSRFPPAGGGPG